MYFHMQREIRYLQSLEASHEKVFLHESITKLESGHQQLMWFCCSLFGIVAKFAYVSYKYPAKLCVVFGATNLLMLIIEYIHLRTKKFLRAGDLQTKQVQLYTSIFESQIDIRQMGIQPKV